MNVAAENERAVIGGNNPPIPDVLAEQHKDLIAKIEPIAERANKLPRVVKNDEQLGIVGALVIDANELSKKLEAHRKAEKQPYLDQGREVDAFFNPLIDRLDRIADTFEEISTAYQREKIAAERRARAAKAEKLREAEEKKRAEAEAAKRETTAERKHDEADEIALRAAQAESKANAANKDLGRMQTATGVKVGAKTEWQFEITDYEAIPLDRLRPYFRREEVEKAIRSLVKIQKGSTTLAGVRVFEDISTNFRR